MIDIEKIVEVAKGAGDLVMQIYNKEDFKVSTKEDSSPLTEADIASSNFILKTLKEIYPDISILSEEEEDAPYEERKSWDLFWSVDPIDGTKGFVNRDGNFAINIGLVRGGKPYMGVVHAPALGVTYISNGEISWKEESGVRNVIHAAKPDKTLVVVGSKNHQSPELLEFVEEKKKDFEKVEFVSMGSALKICLVADGTAHVYPRFGRTMEWDTAAGHAIVNNAGGKLVQMNGDEFVYNKEDVGNPGFIVSSK